MQPLGQSIRARRTALGLTLGDVASRSGCAPGYLSQIENARRDHPPTPGMLRRLERALEMAPDSLVLAAMWERAPREVRAEMVRLTRIVERYDALVRLVHDHGLADAYASGALAEALAESVGERKTPTRAGRAFVDPAHDPVRVPVINRARDGYPESSIDIAMLSRGAEHFVEAPGIVDPGTIAIRVVGDGMAPDYLENDIVVCEPAHAPLRGDDRFVRLATDEPAVFLRVFPEGATVIRLQPVNCRHPARIVDRADIATMHRAVRVIRQIPVA